MRFARQLSALSLMVLVIGGVAAPSAQRESAGSQPPAVQAPGQPAAEVDDRDAEQTRSDLALLLTRYPPSVGRVLKLDPSLLSNQAYLSTYPALAAFLSRHPEIAHNPQYYLATIQGADGSWQPMDAKSRIVEMWADVFEGLMIFLVFATVTAVLVWFVKTLIEWRRWSRLSRVHAETHTKLLDRFATNQDLLAYIETPAGRRFLEAGPAFSENAVPPAVSAPISRILWSVQAGIVLSIFGVGLLLVSRTLAEPEMVQPVMFFGVLAVALGVGFICAAGASYMLSQRMGLFEPLAGREPGRHINAA